MEEKKLLGLGGIGLLPYESVIIGDGTYHDAAATLIVDGEIVSKIKSEIHLSVQQKYSPERHKLLNQGWISWYIQNYSMVYEKYFYCYSS